MTPLPLRLDGLDSPVVDLGRGDLGDSLPACGSLIRMVGVDFTRIVQSVFISFDEFYPYYPNAHPLLDSELANLYDYARADWTQKWPIGTIIDSYFILLHAFSWCFLVHHYKS